MKPINSGSKDLIKDLNFLTAIGIIYYLIFLQIFGGNFLVYLNVAFSLFLAFYLKNYFHNTIFFVPIIYLLFFDNPNSFINFGGILIRPWYLFLLILFYLVIKNLINKKEQIFIYLKNNLKIFFTITLFFILNLIVMKDQNLFGFFHQFKTLIFSFGLIVLLVYLGRFENINNIVLFTLYLVIFIFIWSIIQKIFYELFYNFKINISGINFQHDWGTREVPAFFSERTWIGQFLFFGSLLSYYLFKNHNKNIYLFFIFFFCIGVFLSLSRSGIFPLILIGIYFLIKYTMFSRSQKNNYVIIYIILFFLLTIIFLNFTNIISLDSIISKIENPIGHRKLIFINFWSKLDQLSYIQILFGQGFNWNNEVTFWGSGMGSKSVNIIIRFFNIYGIFGLLIFLSLNFAYIKKIISLKNMNNFIEISIILYIFYMSLALFVPVHLYPPTHIFIIFSIIFLYAEENGKHKK